MPKTNPYLIPKENKAQIEEVREIENEIPSFEEFMKTYEEDERTIDNYYYEIDSYGDIRIVKCYGPGFFDDFILAPAVIGKKASESPMAKFGAKVAITTTAGIVLGPAAIPVGAAVWGGSKIAQECCDNEDDKKVFGFISDCGRDTLTGGIIGGIAGEVGGAIGNKAFEGTAQVATKNADKVAGKVFGSWAAKEIAQGGSKEAYATFAREATRIMSESYGSAALQFGNGLGRAAAGVIEPLITSGLIPINEVRIHMKHLEDGISYKSGCAVCEA